MTTKKATTELRRCAGSARFGIEPHETPISEFPKQPSRKDGLGTMCTEHWQAYVKVLREARKGAMAADGSESDAAWRGTRAAHQRAPGERPGPFLLGWPPIHLGRHRATGAPRRARESKRERRCGSQPRCRWYRPQGLR